MVEYNLGRLSRNYNKSTSRHWMFAHEYVTGSTTDHRLSQPAESLYIKNIEHINNSATRELQTQSGSKSSQN